MKVALTVLALLCVLPAALCAITAVSTPAVRGFSVTSNLASQPATSVFAVRFTGLSTNLVSGTDFSVAAAGGSTGAWSFTISNLNTGNYSVSDDSGSTWNTNSGAGWLTQCMSPDVPAITLDTSAANSNTYSSSGRLRLRLRFLENNRYSAIAYRFRGGEVNCNSTISNAVAATFQSWTRTPSTASCGAPFMSYEQDFNDALTRCNYFRDESNPVQTVFNATIVIATTDTGVVIRSVRYARNLESTVTIRIAFNTNITTSNNAVSVFGPRITFGLVTQQVWNPATFVATVTLITSVQWPYQLALTSNLVTPAVPADWSTRTVAPTPQDSANDVNGVAWANLRSACYNTSNPSAAGASPSLAGNICNQYWTVTLTRNQTCNGGNSLTLAGVFTMFFNVTCPSTFTGACSATAPFNDQVTFSTNSTNFCPQIVTNNNLNSATLISYSTNGYNTPQTQYVFGTISYFQVNVTSPILMNSVGIESINVPQGGTGTGNYYTRTYNNAAQWFSQNNGVYTTFALCGGNSYASSVQVFDNVNTGNSFTKLARFTILWGTCTSVAVGDAPQATTVAVNLRIRYANQSTFSALTLYAKAHHLPIALEDSDQSSASASVSIAPAADTPVASASESSSSTAMVVGVIAGVAAATALLVGITVYMLRRGKGQKSEQTSSIHLTSTNTSTESNNSTTEENSSQQ